MGKEKGMKKLPDESMDFDDIQNPNDSSRVALVSKSNLAASQKYMNRDFNNNADEMSDNYNGGAAGYSNKDRSSKRTSNSQLDEGESNENKGNYNPSTMQGPSSPKDFRRGSQNVYRNMDGSNKLELEKDEKHKSTKSLNAIGGGAVPQGNFDGMDEERVADSPLEHVEPMIGNGFLNENVNKRSEAANRKYRAFVHFLKYNKNSNNGKKESQKIGEVKFGSQDKTKDGQNVSEKANDPKKIDELSQASDADDDFDDRYIHLIAAHSEINKAWGVIYPDSTLKGVWDLLCLFFIIYQAIMIPFRLCFDVDASGGLLILEDFMDGCFMLDILITFNTGFYKKGYLVMKRKEIVKNYLKTWFFLDLLASFPYSWVFNTSDSDSEEDSSTNSDDSGTSTVYKTPQLLRLLKIVRFLRFLRLLRVLKLKKLLYKFEEIIMSDMLNAILGFFKVITVILFIAHWIACIFFAIGSSELDTEPICWIVMSNIQDSSVFDKYIISLYWAFTTMTTVGYGDVVPYTMSEKIYAMFSMLIACGVFAYVVGSIETIARRSNTMAAIFKEKILHVNQFLMHKQIPKYLRLKVRRYLEYMFEYKKQYKLSEIEVLNMLNENLKDQVIVHLNGRMLKNTKIFGIFEIRFLSEVTFLLLNETFSMDDHIFEEDEKGTKMYFITKGTVVIMQKKSHTYIKELQVDEYFGEISFFSDLNRQATARSRGFTEVLSLNNESFTETALQQYPDANKIYYDIHQKLTNEKDFNAIFVTCYLCGKQGHISVECIEQFNEIEGNLKKQIYKIKKLLKQQKEAQENPKKSMNEAAAKLGINKNKEENEVTETIKSEVHLHVDSSCSSCERWESVEKGDVTERKDKSGNSGTLAVKEDQKKRRGSKEISGIKGIGSPQKASGGSGGIAGGGFRLNISVGANNLENAAKFKKIDQELQKQNLGDIKGETKKGDDTDISPTPETVKEEKVDKMHKELIQIPQESQLEVPSLGKDKSSKQPPPHKITSTHLLLKNLEKEGSSMKMNTSINQSNIDLRPVKDSPMNQKQPKSILKNVSSQDQTLNKKTPSVSSQTYSASSSSSDTETENKESEEEVKSRPSTIQARKKSLAPSMFSNKAPLIEVKASNNRRMSRIVSNDNNIMGDRSLIELKSKKSDFLKNPNKMPSHSNLGMYDQGFNGNLSSKSSKFKPSNLNNSKYSNEAHIENYIKSISPFKDIVKFDKEQSQYVGSTAGINQFLPSLNEHKQAILSGSMNKQKLSFKQPKEGRKQIKRSMTLLGNIKEVPEKKAAQEVGVVPKDLGFDFIKDLIDITDNDEDDKQNQEQQKRRNNMKKMKNKKSMYNLQ